MFTQPETVSRFETVEKQTVKSIANQTTMMTVRQQLRNEETETSGLAEGFTNRGSGTTVATEEKETKVALCCFCQILYFFFLFKFEAFMKACKILQFQSNFFKTSFSWHFVNVDVM